MEKLKEKLKEKWISKGWQQGAPEKSICELCFAPTPACLTVGVDSGDRWNQYCSLGLEGETLAEGASRTTPADITAQATAIAITHATSLVLLVDQDRVRELPAIFPRLSFQWPSYWAEDSPRLRSSLFRSSTPKILALRSIASTNGELTSGYFLDNHHYAHWVRPSTLEIIFRRRLVLCARAAEARAIVVRALAACTASAFVARVPADLLLFRAAIPTLGLSPRSRDRPRRVAEMFVASRAKAGRYTFSGAQRVQRCDTPLQGWAPRPPVFRIGSIFGPRQSAHPTTYGFGVAVCAIASVRNC
jgi:hypothetical protein